MELVRSACFDASFQAPSINEEDVTWSSSGWSLPKPLIGRLAACAGFVSDQ